MTDSEAYQLEGQVRANYRDAKKELGLLKAKASKLAEIAATLNRGLENPELVRWFDGTPLIGRRQEHIMFTPAMFTELTESNVRQLWDDIRKVSATIGALRTKIIEIAGEDPER